MSAKSQQRRREGAKGARRTGQVGKSAGERVSGPVRAGLANGLFTDAECAEIVRLANLAIHEVVFTGQHIEDDQIEEAQQALMTAQSNLCWVEEKLLEKARARESAFRQANGAKG